MLLSEFENLTDIKPDSILYSVIEKEYNAQTEDGKDVWDSKAQFCHAFKFDEDGLAEECQRIANEEIWRRDEQYRKAQMESANRITELYNECEHYKAEYQNAHDINAELMQRVEELEHEIETQRRVMQDMKSDQIKADMMDILMRYVHEGVDAADIGCAAVSYTDLYDRRSQNAAD